MSQTIRSDSTHTNANDNEGEKIPIQSSININTRYDRYPWYKPVAFVAAPKMNSMWTNRWRACWQRKEKRQFIQRTHLHQQMLLKEFHKKKRRSRADDQTEKEKCFTRARAIARVIDWLLAPCMQRAHTWYMQRLSTAVIVSYSSVSFPFSSFSFVISRCAILNCDISDVYLFFGLRFHSDSVWARAHTHSIAYSFVSQLRGDSCAVWLPLLLLLFFISVRRRRLWW